MMINMSIGPLPVPNSNNMINDSDRVTEISILRVKQLSVYDYNDGQGFKALKISKTVKFSQKCINMAIMNY
jgi:hypothetical protein